MALDDPESDFDFDQSGSDEFDGQPETDTPTTEEIATQNIGVTPEGSMVISGFEFTPTSLVLADPGKPPSFEDWDRVGVFLRYIHVGSQFWLGDWLNFGESNYGEKYAQAVEHTGYELHTLQTYAWVSRQVPQSNRLEGVPFGHYVNGIAALPTDQQAQWAKRVADENLTQSQLKNALAEKRASEGKRPVDLWLVVLCKNQADFDKLEKQMRAQGREVTSRVTPQRKPKAEKKPKLAKGAKTGGKVTQKPVGKPTKKKPAGKPAATVATENKPPSPAPQQTATTATASVNETPEQKKKRLKRESNARFRAKQKQQKGK